LKKRATNDIQLNQAEINELRRSNSEIGKEFEKLALQAENDRKQRDSLMNSAVTF
jgi:FtsZ-binding cell division protein ZapB